MVKAMLYFNPQTPGYTIGPCFNSRLLGAAATTPPCGFSATGANGAWQLYFPFSVSSNFVSVTTISPGFTIGALAGYPASNAVNVLLFEPGLIQYADVPFYMIVY